jgi:hypothetical protein
MNAVDAVILHSGSRPTRFGGWNTSTHRHDTGPWNCDRGSLHSLRPLSRTAEASGLARRRRSSTRLDRADAVRKGSEAKAKAFGTVAKMRVPWRLVGTVARAHFAPDETMTNCQSCTSWGLPSAFNAR